MCSFISVGAKKFGIDAIWLEMLNEVDTSSRSPTGGSQILVKKTFLRVVLP